MLAKLNKYQLISQPCLTSAALDSTDQCHKLNNIILTFVAYLLN